MEEKDISHGRQLSQGPTSWWVTTLGFPQKLSFPQPSSLSFPNILVFTGAFLAGSPIVRLYPKGPQAL